MVGKQGCCTVLQKIPSCSSSQNNEKTEILVTNADIRTWLPGDNLYDDTVLVPSNMSRGEYDLQIGILDPMSNKPKVKLALSGKQPDGWYYLGKIKIRN